MPLTNKDVKENIDKKFKKIHEAKSIEDLLKIEEYHTLSSFVTNTDLYPKIDFKISPSEIANLVDLGFITEEGNISVDKLESIADPLARLFLLVLWKNGDFLKIKHIVFGIKDAKKINQVQDDEALVFRQLGRFISGKNQQPIIDQHIIRAHAVFTETNLFKIKEKRKIETLSQDHQSDIDNYRSWLYFKNSFTPELRACKDYIYYIDRILMALGKYAKY